MRDRRRTRRLAIKTPISWHFEGHKGRKLNNGFLFDAQNITASGLFLKTHLRPKIGTHLKLKFDLNNHRGPIKLKGKVVWVATKKKHSYRYPGVGIKFGKMDEEDRKRLNTFIKNKLSNYRDANELKNMYLSLKEMASRLVELEERHSTAMHFKRAIDCAVNEIDNVAHILDREINEIKKM